MKGKKALIVQWEGETVGHLSPHRRGNVTFAYASEWLSKYNQPISLSLPCSAESFGAQKSTAFFANLLPEEGMYKDLCRELACGHMPEYLAVSAARQFIFCVP
jgi:serine/threonine-protein kinase HipA